MLKSGKSKLSFSLPSRFTQRLRLSRYSRLASVKGYKVVVLLLFKAAIRVVPRLIIVPEAYIWLRGVIYFFHIFISKETRENETGKNF